MKTIKVSILLSLIYINSFAQEKGTSQINVGYGVGSYMSLFKSFVETLTTSNEEEPNTNGGAFQVGYKYAIADQFLIGGIAVVENIRVINSNERVVYTTFAVEVDYRYLSTEYFQMYSGLGLGYSLESIQSDMLVEPRDELNFFNCQVTGVGVRVGKTFAGFIELGFGYKGLINLGVSTQF